MPFKSLDDVPAHLENRHPGSRWVVWRPKPRASRWLVRLDFGKSQDGSLAECIGLEIRSFREDADGGWPEYLPQWDESPMPLQRRTLRDVPLGQMLDDLGGELLDIMMSWAQSFKHPIGNPEDDVAAMRDAVQIEQFVAHKRARKPDRGRRGIPDLGAIAQVYLHARASREPATRAVAEWGTVSESTASKWIMRVRRDTNLLPPPATTSQQKTKRGARS